MAEIRKLGRTTSHRLAMLKSLTTSLLLNGKIETTYTRAQEVAAKAEEQSEQTAQQPQKKGQKQKRERINRLQTNQRSMSRLKRRWRM